MNTDFCKYIDNHYQELIKLIQDIVKLPSVKDQAVFKYPFGKNIGVCLETVLSEARKMGFHTVNLDGYIGYAEYGEGEEYIAVIGHLDVVPEGDGWTYPPYGAEIYDGILYGRGVLDNKAPILSCLFALKCLKELNCEFPYKIRIIFGTDEESGFNDIPYYLLYEKLPLMGFTPDCKFPVVYGENGILRMQISQELLPAPIVLESVCGDFQSSVVPDFCQMNFIIDLSQVNTDSLLGEFYNLPLSCLLEGNQLTISYTGRRAPANNPYLGDNAIISLISHLPQTFLRQSNINDFSVLIQRHLNDIYGKHLAFHDDVTGDLMITVYDFFYQQKDIGIRMTLRYPLNCPIDSKLSELQDILKDYQYVVLQHMPAVNFPLDHPVVRELSAVYKEVTGLNSNPVTTTGGTYAKMMPNIVAFGPSFPGERGIAHNRDEYMSIAHIILITKIYTNALYRISRIERKF